MELGPKQGLEANGISKLTILQLILQGEISCIRGSSEIPLQSVAALILLCIMLFLMDRWP